MSIISTLLLSVGIIFVLPVYAYSNEDIPNDTPLDNFPGVDQNNVSMPPVQMPGNQSLPLAPTGLNPAVMQPTAEGIPEDNSLSSPNQGALSGYQSPNVQTSDDSELPYQSSGTYPAGMQPAQDIAIPGTPANAAPPAAIAPLIVAIQTNFTGTMAEDIDLAYQYFYTNVRRMPWEGYIHLRNHSQDQSVEIPRSSDVSSLMLFLRPGGAGSAQCVPVGGQSPQVFNNTSRVTLIGTTDAGGNFNCQLIYG